MIKFGIILTDGKIIYIKADIVEWSEKTRMVLLIKDRYVVARINMDNVAGYIVADNQVNH